MTDPPVECCPTCGSDAPAVRYVVAPLGNGGEYECGDEYHDAPLDADNPLPED